MTALRSKPARHQAIVEFINRRVVRTQDELRGLLAEQGFAVTQATLSRDLDELGAIKVHVGGGTAYALRDGYQVEPLADADSTARLARVCSETVTGVSAAQNLVVAHTRPGAAHYLASAIDRDAWPEVVGSVAGDDTVIIVASTNAKAVKVAETLTALAASRTPSRSAGA